MTTPHPHADLLRAIADGKQMQQDFIEQGWTYIAPSSPAAKQSGAKKG